MTEPLNTLAAEQASFLHEWGYPLALLSVFTLIASALLIPWLILRIPVDYFTDKKRHESRLKALHPAAYISIMVLKNLAGLVFLLAGIAMLVLPGQGVLTMLVGIFLINFPGKYHFERWLINHDFVYKSINWVRRRGSRAPLLRPGK